VKEHDHQDEEVVEEPEQPQDACRFRTRQHTDRCQHESLDHAKGK
jgi:hypothetical protein